MARYLIKIDRSKAVFRFVIPRSVILEKRWGDVAYLLLEDCHKDKLVLRRFLDAESLQDQD